MPDGNKPSDEEQCLIKEIEKEIEKVKFFMEEIEIEMEIVNTEAVKIITKLSEFISQTEELKMKWWLSPWMVRHSREKTLHQSVQHFLATTKGLENV